MSVRALGKRNAYKPRDEYGRREEGRKEGRKTEGGAAPRRSVGRGRSPRLSRRLRLRKERRREGAAMRHHARRGFINMAIFNCGSSSSSSCPCRM